MTNGPCQALLARVGGDAQVFRELCDLFLDDAPKRLALIREALAAGNARAVQSAAHAFRGAASVFDAVQVVAAARGVEQLATDGDLDGAREMLVTLEAHSDALMTEIAAERPGAK